MEGEIPPVSSLQKVQPEAKDVSQTPPSKNTIYLIFIPVLIIAAYLIFIAITYWNCTKVTPAVCEINKCGFSLAGFNLIRDTKGDCCGNKMCEIGEVYPECKDCPNCNDENKCTLDSYDYNERRCVNKSILNVVCCGNALCEEGYETNSNCSKDCPNCDDKNKLTADSFNYQTQKCENIVTHYFLEDFKDGKTSINKGENWKIIDDQGDKVLDCPGKEINGMENDWGYFGNIDWANYESELTFKLVENQEGFGFHFFSKEEQGYVLDIRKEIISLKKRNRQHREEASSRRFDIKLDEWYRLKTEKTGNNIKIDINNVPLLEYTDNQPLDTGQLSIETFGDGHVRFKSISIIK